MPRQAICRSHVGHLGAANRAIESRRARRTLRQWFRQWTPRIDLNGGTPIERPQTADRTRPTATADR